MSARLLAALLAGACILARPAYSRSDPTVTIGIGDRAEELPKRMPFLASYLAAIKAEVEGTKSAADEIEQEMEKCKKESAALIARGLKGRDCDEEFAFDPPEVHEPATAIQATLAYRDKRVSFDVPGVTLLRLRQRGSGSKGEELISEISADFGPTFPDVAGLLRRFGEFQVSAARVALAVDRSGLPRYPDHPNVPGSRRSLDKDIFTLSSLKRDLEETQFTDELRSRHGGRYHYLLGAWAGDEVYALLAVTGEQDGDVLGKKPGTDRGFRLRVIIGDNALVGGRFRPVDSWDHYFPLDFSRLPKADAQTETQWNGHFCSETEPKVIVARTDEDWRGIWQKLADRGSSPPNADFKSHFAVAVFLGTKPTVGYSIEWTTPPAQAYNVVSYRVRDPKGPAMRVPTQPYAIRVFPYSGGEIKVEEK